MSFAFVKLAKPGSSSDDVDINVLQNPSPGAVQLLNLGCTLLTQQGLLPCHGGSPRHNGNRAANSPKELKETLNMHRKAVSSLLLNMLALRVALGLAGVVTPRSMLTSLSTHDIHTPQHTSQLSVLSSATVHPAKPDHSNLPWFTALPGGRHLFPAHEQQSGRHKLVLYS